MAGAALLVCALLLAGCGDRDRALRLHTHIYQGLNSAPMRLVMQQQADIDIELVAAVAGESALESLTADRADLALVNNSHPFVEGVRAVMPLYQSVLHVLVNDRRGRFTITESLRGLRIYIADNSFAANSIVELLAKRQKLHREDYTLVEEVDPGTTDLILYFGPIYPDNVSWYRPGFSLVDLGADTAEGGIGYLLPRMHPAVIPARVYEVPGNELSLRTVGVDTLLLARRQLSEQLIYDLARVLVEQKPRFMSLAPNIFSGVTDRFNPLDLNFPLHSGARRYLQRDEPTLLERYAEAINLLVYVFFLLITGIVAAYRWRAHRVRDRIDGFYTRALVIRKRADGLNEVQLMNELNELEEEAFRSLLDDKLAADESFRIFTELIARVEQELITAIGKAGRSDR